MKGRMEAFTSPTDISRVVVMGLDIWTEDYTEGPRMDSYALVRMPRISGSRLKCMKLANGIN